MLTLVNVPAFGVVPPIIASTVPLLISAVVATNEPMVPSEVRLDDVTVNPRIVALSTLKLFMKYESLTAKFMPVDDHDPDGPEIVPDTVRLVSVPTDVRLDAVTPAPNVDPSNTIVPFILYELPKSKSIPAAAHVPDGAVNNVDTVAFVIIASLIVNFSYLVL